MSATYRGGKCRGWTIEDVLHIHNRILVRGREKTFAPMLRRSEEALSRAMGHSLLHIVRLVGVEHVD